jgi:flagellar biosynthetic protein FliP
MPGVRVSRMPRRPALPAIGALALLTLAVLLPAHAALAQSALPAIAIKTAADGAQTYSLTFQVLILMTVLTLLPAILLAMTAFTRIIIVLSILRQALGMATTPSNQILTGLALFMTFFVMSSAIEQSYANGIKPYLDGQLAGEMAIDRTLQPLKKFMLAQTRENDLQLFTKLSGRT